MRPSNPSKIESLASDEDGSAVVEFIVVGLLMLVPLVYLVITLGLVQEQTLGAEAAARHTARVIGQAPDAATADARAEDVMDNVIREYGMDADDVTVSVTCVSATAACPEAGATVVVTVNARVSLPFLPPLFGLDEIGSIPIEAQAAQKVSRLWGSE